MQSILLCRVLCLHADSSIYNYDFAAGSVSQFLTVTLLGATLLLILPIVVTGLL